MRPERPAATPPGGVAVYRDVIFSSPAGFRPLSLDLYVPSRPAGALCLYLHGAADGLVPPRQSQRLADALTGAGATATVELVAGAGHMFPELDDEATRRVIERTTGFLLDPATG